MAGKARLGWRGHFLELQNFIVGIVVLLPIGVALRIKLSHSSWNL